MEQTTFENFCKNKALDDGTIQVLRKMGVTNSESLSVLSDEDFTTELDLKQLPLVQRRLLQRVLKELREKPNPTQQSGNEHGPSPAISALKREDIENYEYPDELRLVLIGKTGSGKSSTGNTILNLTEKTGGFDPACGQAAATTTCKRRSVKINETKIRVIDTPGVYDPARDEKEIAEEIFRCLMLCSPGPHALLFVTKGHDRFTDEEIGAYYRLKAMFSSKVTKYIIVVFTGGDVLAKWDKTMEDVLKQAKDAIESNKGKKRATPPVDITKVLQDVSNRYILFNNEGDAATKDHQVLALLDMVMEMINNNGDEPCFQNETTRVVSDVRETELQRIMAEYGTSRREAEAILSSSLQQTIVINNEKGPTSGLGDVVAGAAISAALLANPITPVVVLAGATVAGATALCSAAKDKCCVM